MANLNQQGVDYLVSKIYGAIQDVKNNVNVTYSELKSLRDSNKLIPGCEYRITDYVTTTMQENTISAGHQFDIIVTALDESTLSEEAKAIQNNNDDYFDSCNLSAWKIWYSLDNDVNRFKWAWEEQYAPFVGYSYDPSENLHELDTWIQAIAKVCDDSTDGAFYETLESGLNETFSHFGYTNYNDITQLTLYGRTLEDELDSKHNYHYKGILTIDGVEYDSWAQLVYYEDGSTSYATNGNGGNVYILTNRIVAENCKGVIYRMIDEWGNDCPYDFKNIMFKRGLYADGGGIATKDGEEDFFTYCYTFSWEEDQNVIMDASIFGNNGHLLNGENNISGVYGNIIGVYNNSNDSPQSTKQYLNDIVFFSTYGYVGGIYYGCYSNTFGNDCYENTFGNDCHSNTFGNYCHSNTFGNACYSNTFGNNCYSNTFGNNCYSNTFGNNCYENEFDNDCHKNKFDNYCYLNKFGYGCYVNIFGDDCQENKFYNDCIANKFGYGCFKNTFYIGCYSNTFGRGCNNNNFGEYSYENTFGDNCDKNTFGNDCYENTFGSGCSSNTFGNGCSSNTFGNSCRYNKFGSASNTKSYYRHIIFDNGNSYIRLNCLATTGTSNYYQNVRIGLGVNNKTTYKTIGDGNVGQTYETLYKPAESQTILI